MALGSAAHVRPSIAYLDNCNDCCIFFTVTLDCGGISSENCTHFDSASPAAGECSVTICPCRGDICQVLSLKQTNSNHLIKDFFTSRQLRLDFTNFEITGPQTSSISVVKTTKGELDAAGAAQSLASQCLTDTFTVTSGGITPPVICGTNTGEHSMDISYVEVFFTSQRCNMHSVLGRRPRLQHPGVPAGLRPGYQPANSGL